MRNQAGNISLSVMLGVVGTIGALYQFKGVNQSVRELERQRISAEGEAQVLSNLSRYKGLLSSNAVNSFAIYPDPYLKANPQLTQFSNKLAFQSSFNAGSQTVMLTQPQIRKMSESDLASVMSGASKSADLCKGNDCPKSSVKLLGFNRDTSGPVPERIVSADVEVSTQVIDPKTKLPVEKKIVAQVPMETPQVTSAILRLSEAPTGGAANGKEIGTVDLNTKSNTIKVSVPEIAAELVVGGVAVSAEIAIVEVNKTFSSDDPDQHGLDNQGFPKHGAVSIRNQGSSLVKTPVFTVEDGMKYTVVGRIQGVDTNTPNPELRLILEVDLPPPPDPGICAEKCKDTGKWYDGPFVGGTPGSYATMVPGKYSCMFNAKGDWDNALGNPIYSFDPAENCKKSEVPIGFRTSNLGCFVGETLIRMADGRYKEISRIVAGDSLWNPVLKRAVAVKRVIVGPERNALISIRYSGRRELIVTPDHPFLDRFGNLVQAQQLASLVTTDGLESPLSVTWVENKTARTVFNLEMDAPAHDRDAHFVDANGTVAGDMILQNQLKLLTVERHSLDAGWEGDRWTELKTDFNALKL